MNEEDKIRAGFPSPAQDYMRVAIDLNKELVTHPASTFYGRVVGNSMIDEGVDEGDILVIDKSLEPEEGSLAVCFLDGDFTLKHISFRDPSGSSACSGERSLWLIPSDKAFSPIRVDEDSSFKVWGIVTYVIKKVR